MLNNNQFVYTRPNGVKVVIEPFDIRKLLQLRYFEQRKWYSQHPTQSPEQPTICEEFHIPKSRLDEIRESVEYREMCLTFLSDMGIKRDSDIFEYMLYRTLGVKKPKNGRYYKTEHEDYEFRFHNRSSDFIDDILNDRFGILKDKFGGRSKKITKIDQYRHERKTDFKGVNRNGLVARIKDMIDSRDFWKKKHDETEDRAEHLKAQLETLILKVSNLESENTQLRAKIGRDSRSYNSGSGEINSIMSELPRDIKKIVRNKFMLTAHPDKIGDAMNDLSSEEKQIVNRFFDFFQKLLKT